MTLDVAIISALCASRRSTICGMKLPSSQRTLIVQPLPGIGDMIWHLPHIHAIAATSLDFQVDILTKPRSQADRLLCADPCVRRVLWLERERDHAGVREVLFGHHGVAHLFLLNR